MIYIKFVYALLIRETKRLTKRLNYIIKSIKKN